MSLTRRRFTALLLSAARVGLATETTPPPAAGRKLDLRIGDGFGAREADIRAVLLSAGEAIWQHCPNTEWREPGFFIYHSNDLPVTAYQHRADGRVAIGLTTTGNHWSQFAFQFAHEFCHALAGHSNDYAQLWTRGRKANMWLEEACCETASLFAMRAMGERWKTAPPYPNWKPYAESLVQYARDRSETAAVSLPRERPFLEWFRENEAAMREKATLREKNNVVAGQLLPLFEAEPAGWEAITFLNLGRRDPEESLAMRFAEWSAAAPGAQHAFIGRVAGVFGLKVISRQSPRARESRPD
jgi:hypothetical protein